MSDKKDDDFHSRVASLPRQCISCDACDKPAPSIQCERCQTVYYCDDDCRHRHKAEHHADCHDIATISKHQEAQTPSKEDLLSAASEDAINSECGICMQEQMEQPVTLDCKHAFCSTCLVAWQRQKHNPANEYQSYMGDQTHRCPVCRSETEGTVEEDLLLRAQALASRAALLRKDADAQRNLLEKSLDVLNKLLEVDVPHLQAYITKVEVLNLLGEYQQVIDTIELTMAINNERVEKARVLAGMGNQVEEAMARSNMEEVERLQEEYVNYATENNVIATRISPEDVVELWIKQAEAHIELGEWEAAKDIIMTKTPLGTSPEALSPPRTRRCVMGLARCAYEMKRYDKAIAASDWAIEMNRSFPGVYKYKALAQKAMGNLDAAIVTMNCAVLYETPWDDDNRRKALAMYDGLLVENEQKEQE